MSSEDKAYKAATYTMAKAFFRLTRREVSASQAAREVIDTYKAHIRPEVPKGNAGAPSRYTWWLSDDGNPAWIDHDGTAVVIYPHGEWVRREFTGAFIPAKVVATERAGVPERSAVRAVVLTTVAVSINEAEALTDELMRLLKVGK